MRPLVLKLLLSALLILPCAAVGDDALRKQADERFARVLALGRNNLNEAFAFIASEVPPAERQTERKKLMTALCREKLDLIRQIQLVFPDEESRMVIIDDVAHFWIEKNLVGFEKFIQTLPAGNFSNLVYTRLTEQLARANRFDDVKALIEQAPEQNPRNDLLADAAWHFPAKSVDQVLEWVNSIPDKTKSTEIRIRMFTNFFVGSDPNALRIVALTLESNTRNRGLRRVGELIARRGLKEVLQELGEQKYNPTDREAVVLGAMTTVPFTDLNRLFDLVKTSESSQTRQDAAVAYVLRLLDVHPEDAREWARTAPDDMRKVAIQNIVHSWGMFHPAELSSWIESLPKESDRDLALETWVRLAKTSDPDAAKKAAAKIADPEKRAQMLKSLQ